MNRHECKKYKCEDFRDVEAKWRTDKETGEEGVTLGHIASCKRRELKVCLCALCKTVVSIEGDGDKLIIEDDLHDDCAIELFNKTI